MDQIDTAIAAGAEFEVVRGAIPFKIFTGLLRTFRAADGKLHLLGVASSTVKDRHGDTMEKSAIDDMVQAANDNMTIFLNHSYDVPEDVAGSVEKAAATQRGQDDIGSPIWDLDYDVIVNEINPRAVDAFNAIENGTKLGMSIGAMIPEGGALRNKKTGAYTFRHVDLLETSIVGIPANPRSWVQNAVKALKSATTMQVGSPTISLDDDGNYEIKGRLAEGSVRLSTPDGEIGIENVKTEEPDQSGDPDELEDLEASAGLEEPTATPGDGEPEVQDAKIQVITIDTDDSKEPAADSQAAPGSEPDTESDDDVYDSAQAETLAATLTGSLDVLETTAAALVETRAQLDLAIEERDAARRERDEVSEMALGLIASTSQIIDKLASMPVGRKAVIREARDELSGLERLYGPEVLKLIRSNHENG